MAKKRREKGTGYIFQRANVRWVTEYQDERMAKPKTLYGKSKPEVLDLTFN